MKNKAETITISIIIIISIILLLMPIVCFPLKNQSEFENHFRKEVFEMLPKQNLLKSIDIQIDDVYGYEYLGYCSENILYEYAQKEFVKKVSQLESKFIAKYNYCDSCLISVFLDNEICGKDSNYYPIHNEYISPYQFLDFSKGKDYLGERVQYYVLDCKEGWFLKDEKLKNIEGKRTKYLRCRTFEHGYSVGAIVDEERLRIAYWVMVW